MNKHNHSDNLQAIIIHLTRNEERAKNAASLKESLPLVTEILAATDSAELTQSALNCYVKNRLKPRYPFVLNKGEIACFLSHRRAWQTIVDNDLKGAFICEDDIAVDINQFEFAVDIICSNSFDIVRFPDITRRAQKVIGQIAANKSQAISFNRTEVIGLGMQLTYVSKHAAEVLLTRTASFDRPVDTYLQLRFDHELDILTCDGVTVEDISKELGGTQVGATKKRTFLSKLHKEIFRPIYKIKLLRSNKSYLDKLQSKQNKELK